MHILLFLIGLLFFQIDFNRCGVRCNCPDVPCYVTFLPFTGLTVATTQVELCAFKVIWRWEEALASAPKVRDSSRENAFWPRICGTQGNDSVWFVQIVCVSLLLFSTLHHDENKYFALNRVLDKVIKQTWGKRAVLFDLSWFASGGGHVKQT